MARILLVIVGILAGAVALAQESGKTMTIPVSPAVDRLRISGFRGNVRLLGQAPNARQSPSNSLYARVVRDNNDSDWSYALQKDGNVINLVIQGPQDKRAWEQMKTSPRFDIDVWGVAGLVTEIYWHEGDFVVRHWKGDLHITDQAGKIQLTGGEGDDKLFLDDGEIKVEDFSGRLEVNSYTAKITAAKVKGAIHLENFSGETKLTDWEGDLNLAAVLGRSVLTQGKGRFDFSNGKGELQAKDIEGPVRGKGGEGSLNFDLKGRVDFRIQGNEGNVSLKLPSQSGAVLNLGSEEGEIRVPVQIKVLRENSSKSAQGRLRGDEPGAVHVRTSSGRIAVRGGE